VDIHSGLVLDGETGGRQRAPAAEAGGQNIDANAIKSESEWTLPYASALQRTKGA
jgi:hypothetical protein